MKTYNPDNPFAQPESLTQLVFLVTADALDALEDAFEDVAFAFSCSAADDGQGRHKVEVICDSLDAAIGLAQCGLEPLSQSEVEERDWVAEVQADFKPMHAGRFYVYGSHIESAPPKGSIPILMDAGAAFGTGEHATTSGCLQLLSRIRPRPSRVLDMGAGTAILGIGAAKRWPTSRVLAVDNCPVAVRVSAANALRNQVQQRVRCAVSEGYNSRIVRENGPYDIILANILAGPLIEMAADQCRTIKAGGYLILSGLLNRQERKVLNAYEARGFKLLHAARRDDWSALLLRAA